MAADPVYFFSHVAGATTGSQDGSVLAARFLSPTGVAVGGFGEIYVADMQNRTIRKITLDGKVVTFAGQAGQRGALDGTGPAARFEEPRDIAADRQGNLYVADRRNAIIRKITSSGEVSTLAGLAGSTGDSDGTGSVARFHAPAGIAVDALGNIYVADEGSHTIRKITRAGAVSTLAGHAGAKGSDDGKGSDARLNAPSGIAVDWSGNIYVADTGNFTLRKITPTGGVTTMCGVAGRQGTRDGSGAGAEFSSPRGIAATASGNLYVTDGHAIRKVTPAGAVTTWVGVLWSYAGSFEDDALSAARFSSPTGVAIDDLGNLIVADTGNHALRRVTSNGVVRTMAGPEPDMIHRGVDGPVASATFGSPADVAVGDDGSLLVADFDYRDCKIRKISAAGMVSSLAQVGQPVGITVGRTGYVYVADWGPQVVRQIFPDGETTVLAGSLWSSGTTDGIGAAARFGYLDAIEVDLDGNLLVADNSAVRKVTPAGVVSTIAGMKGMSGFANGSLTNARFGWGLSIAVGPDGSIYVADWSNQVVRRISLSAPADQAVTTVAGSPGLAGNVDGIGPNARLAWPRGLAADAGGNLYVTEDSDTIRKITPEGRVITIGGRANTSGRDDGPGPEARFSSLNGIAVDRKGVLYVADSGNNAIRRGVPVTSPAFQREPRGQAVAPWDWIRLSADLSGDPLALQWRYNGGEVDGATSQTLMIGDVQPSNSGLYTLHVENMAGTLDSRAAIVGISSTAKVVGAGRELAPTDVRHPTGNIFDQVLLTGPAVAVTADYDPDPAKNQITRTSFVDLDDDIVQVEFGGPGTLSLVLENPTGPATPVNYNQATTYVKGHAGIVITGATEATNVSVFSVGKATAVNQALFKEGLKYDGIADLAFIAILSSNGKFGGVRTANANYFAAKGHTGLYAPGVMFTGPVFIGNITAFDAATPVLQVGSVSDARITGGDLAQANGAAVQVSGLTQLKFTAGGDSHGNALPAQANKAVLKQDGVDVTAQVVVNP